MLSKALALIILALPAGVSSAGDTVAVLSSASGVYMDAFKAFQKEHGSKVRYFDASRKPPVLPRGTRTVVAFGAKAAGLKYPAGTNLVYTLAPGFIATAGRRSGATVKISMIAPPDIFLSHLKEIQPSLKKLHIFWRSPNYADLPHTYEEAGSRADMEIRAVRVDREEELPDALRGSLGQYDAFWLPPDPLLISDTTLPVFIQFSQDNAVPMYVSTKGLARKGACASIGIGFEQAGEAAAAAVKDLRDGKKLRAVIYHSDYQMTLNASAARYCGINFPPSIISKAHHYFP